MVKDRGLNFETQLKIEFLPPHNGSKKCWEKSLLTKFINYICKFMEARS